MFWAQAAVLLAVAAVTVASSLDLRSLSMPKGERSASASSEELRSFLLVGAAALAVLSLVVVGVGVTGRDDRAEGLAVFGLFAYLAYLVLTVVVRAWLRQRARGRESGVSAGRAGTSRRPG